MNLVLYKSAALWSYKMLYRPGNSKFYAEMTFIYEQSPGKQSMTNRRAILESTGDYNVLLLGKQPDKLEYKFTMNLFNS